MKELPATHGAKVKARILAAGLDIWRRDGREAVSARRIGRALDMTHGACLYHFTNAAGLQEALAAEAVRICDPVIVPQLIAVKHPSAEGLTGDERRRYLDGC